MGTVQNCSGYFSIFSIFFLFSNLSYSVSITNYWQLSESALVKTHSQSLFALGWFQNLSSLHIALSCHKVSGAWPVANICSRIWSTILVIILSLITVNRTVVHLLWLIYNHNDYIFLIKVWVLFNKTIAQIKLMCNNNNNNNNNKNQPFRLKYKLVTYNLIEIYIF